jgi:hypothetical protein
VFTLATIILLISLLLWVMGDLVFHDKTYQTYFYYLFIASLALYAIGIIMKIGGKLLKPFMTNKCSRCGTPIPKGHIYCSTHDRDIHDETREKLEATWKKKGMK